MRRRGKNEVIVNGCDYLEGKDWDEDGFVGKERNKCNYHLLQNRQFKRKEVFQNLKQSKSKNKSPLSNINIAVEETLLSLERHFCVNYRSKQHADMLYIFIACILCI